MNLVNLMYRYINKFINSDRLLNELKDLDLSKFSEEEREIISTLISDVKNIIDTVPNELDEIEKGRIGRIDHMLEILDKNNNLENNGDKEAQEFIDKYYNNLLNEKNVTKDGGKLYTELFQLMTNNSLVIKYAKRMNDEELLEFITKYISVPFPPVINQEGFNDLVSVGIKDDKREALWRLAFNYNRKNIDFFLIEDYFIEKRDSYYLTELISVVKEDLNMDKLIQKIIFTKDKKFINNFIKSGKKLNLITEEEIKRLKTSK